MSHRVTLLPGDSVGPEVADAVREIVDATGVDIEWDEVTVGVRAMVNHGTPLPPVALESIRRNRVALKGRIVAPPGAAMANPNVDLRRSLGLFAQVRPVRSLPGSRYPDLDLVVVRECTEGEYAGLEHRVVPGVVESIKVVTATACRRIGEFAFDYASRLGRKKVTAVHKANILKKSDGLFLSETRAVAAKYPEIAYEELIVDNTSMQLVIDPYRFDVLVTESFYGDLISDLCAGLAGGISAARAVSLGEGLAVFEAVHGEAPSLAGKNLANPLTLLGSAVMLLQHLEEEEAAQRLDRAIERVLTDRRCLTRDLGGSARTAEMSRALQEALD